LFIYFLNITIEHLIAKYMYFIWKWSLEIKWSEFASFDFYCF